MKTLFCIAVILVFLNCDEQPTLTTQVDGSFNPNIDILELKPLPSNNLDIKDTITVKFCYELSNVSSNHEYGIEMVFEPVDFETRKPQDLLAYIGVPYSGAMHSDTTISDTVVLQCPVAVIESISDINKCPLKFALHAISIDGGRESFAIWVNGYSNLIIYDKGISD